MADSPFPTAGDNASIAELAIDRPAASSGIA
jgi:hypothetical protein